MSMIAQPSPPSENAICSCGKRVVTPAHSQSAAVASGFAVNNVE